MPLFALTCIDEPNALDLRMATREAHLAYVGVADARLRLGGPFLDDNGQMAGSLMIVEAADLAGAKAFNAADPYQRAGLFESVDIREFRVTIGAL